MGLYPDGQPGEIFLKMAKEGSTVSGLMDTLATMTSLALQYGVPLRDLVTKFTHVRFEPSGFTGNPEVPIAKSIVDYIFRWMGSRFLSKDDRDALGIMGGEVVTGGTRGLIPAAGRVRSGSTDRPNPPRPRPRPLLRPPPMERAGPGRSGLGIERPATAAGQPAPAATARPWPRWAWASASPSR